VLLKVVVDTNLLVSGIIKRGGRPDILLRRWLAGDFLIVTCPAALDELFDVLNRPKIRRKYNLSAGDG
jgi:putative PIN family toxin of toxin-antitoxin system